MQKKESQSTSIEGRKNTPMRTQSTANRSIDSNTPNTKCDSPFNIIVELLKIIVKKVQELEIILARRPNTGFIAINQKSLHYAHKQIEQPKFEALIQRLDTLSPIRFSKQLKNNMSPANIAFQEMQLKLLIGEQMKPLKEEVEEIGRKMETLHSEVTETFSNYEQQLIEVITAIKNFVSERKKG